MSTSTDASYPLRAIAKGWMDAIKIGLKYREEFDRDAAECMKYLKGTANTFGRVKKGAAPADGELDDIPPPSHRLTVNKAYEFKSIYGPVLYHRNPQFRVTGRIPPQMPPDLFGNMNDPQTQMMWQMVGQQAAARQRVTATRAEMLQYYLNYLPNEVGLKEQSRLAIDHALITGLAYLWPEIVRPPGSNIKLLGATWVDSQDVVCDPDMHSIKDAYWWARRRVAPYWEAERIFELDEGTLKPYTQYESGKQQATGQQYRRRQKKETGRSNDLIEWWEVYSRMGFGGRLSGKKLPDELHKMTEEFGDYCFIAVATGVPFPLNLSNKHLNEGAAPGASVEEQDQQLFARVQWPVPFYLDDRPPFAYLAFHEIPGELYPISPLKPGLPELRFLSWCMSYMASKIRVTCRDFIAIIKSASDELKTKVLHGPDLTLLEIERTQQAIGNVVQFLQHPQFNDDIYKVYAAVSMNFEKRVGLTELHYAVTDKQIRTATEAQVKENAMNVRPDDMLNKVEDCMTDVGRMWAMMARWYIDPDDVAPVGGPIFSHFWPQMVMSADMTEVTREIDLRVEAGSTKKPNFQRDQEQMQQMGQVAMPVLQAAWQMTGDPTGINNFLADWAKSVQVDPMRYQVPMTPGTAIVESEEKQDDRESKEAIADKKAAQKAKA